MKGSDPTWYPNIAASLAVSVLSTLIGKMHDFWKFTFNPVDAEKIVSMFLSASSWESTAGTISKVSSAY